MKRSLRPCLRNRSDSDNAAGMKLSKYVRMTFSDRSVKPMSRWVLKMTWTFSTDRPRWLFSPAPNKGDSASVPAAVVVCLRKTLRSISVCPLVLQKTIS
ncbi:MAG: hypothetical protein ACYS32_02190 [Planctomycetota bacterium]